MVKPFSIQAPEEVAKVYGGDKQKIAQAAQMGIVDPTAAVLAGMFIDKMRSAQMQENANPPTIAQQVMGGAPAGQGAPPASSSPAGGLGATPQAAPPMAPQGMAPQGMAPQGMAAGGSVPPYASGGGLSDVPIPDTMFDEPSNGGFGDGYAGGGIVAFAQGGDTEYEAFKRAIIQQESGGRYGVPNAQGSGAMGVGQLMPATARALAARLGLGYHPELLAGTSPEARQYQNALTDAAAKEAWNYGGGDPAKAAGYYFAGPNLSGWKGKTRQYQSDIMNRMGQSSSAPAPSAGLGALAAPPSTPPMSLESAVGEASPLYDKLFPAPKREGRDAMLAYAKELGDPEQLKKQANEDKWMTLAQIGFGIASSNSPYFLQAVGTAAAAALPAAREAKKERDARKREALKLYADVEGLDNQEAKDRVNGILNLAGKKLDMSKDEIARQFETWKTQYTQGEETKRTGMQIAGQKAVAGIAAEQRMDKGLEGLMNSYLQMGINEAKGKGIPVDLPSLKATAYEKALAEWNKYKAQQGGITDANNNGIPDMLERTGTSAAPAGFDPSQYKVH